MSIPQLLNRLKASEISVRLADGQLKLNAPKGRLTPEMLREIKDRKSDIIRFLETVGSQSRFSSIEPVAKQDHYPLSSAQKRMYILQKMEPSGTSYNMPHVLPLPADAEIQRLEQAFVRLSQRHESLRTAFVELEEEPVQKVLDAVEVGIERFDSFPNDFVRPFDLSRPPLFRLALVKGRDGECFLLFDLHHIISDGVSQAILTAEFNALYRERELPPLALQYKDYAVWQQKRRQDGVLEKQEKYWLNVFPPEEELPVLDLPLDSPRPPIQRFVGDTLRFSLDEAPLSAFEKILEERGCTLFMGLLAVFDILLFRLTGQEDIVVGTPASGRPHADLEAIIGMFVNTLALRNRPRGDMTVGEFLDNVRIGTIEAFDNQDLQFEDLVEKVVLRRDAGRNPLFDVMFALQNIRSHDSGAAAADRDRDDSETIEEHVAKFDLTLNGVKRGGRVLFRLDYAVSLFKKETLERWITYFKTLVELFPLQLDSNLYRLELMSPEEKKCLAQEFNDTNRPLPEDRTVVDMFKHLCEKNGSAVAVVEGEHSVTYEGLYRRAIGLAAQLRSTGLELGGLAAVVSEASIDMVTGIWAILFCGAAYLPVDPGTPGERIEFMLRDSAASHVLRPSDFKHLAASGEAAGATVNPTMPRATDAAYVIYTSGSTGQPKGVVVYHRSLLNLCFWHIRQFSVSAQDRATKYAGVGFDASVWEIFPYLTAGASIYIVPEEIKLDVGRLDDYFDFHRISITFLPTQMAEQFMAYSRNRKLRILLTGGDKLREFSPRPYLAINNYGPTENTVVSTCYTIDEQSANIPIGKPVDNAQTYILDRWDNLQPIGVAGELCVAGESLAAGYLNRPELTAEKFVPNPFKPGELMYRTGDLASFQPDGNIRFLGRIDFQVKIRGFRIELGEIEGTLLAHPLVSDVAVIDLMDPQQEKYLAAYVVLAEAIDEERLSKELGQFLSQSLPFYMIPSVFVTLERIPLNTSGKVNRRALPIPEQRATGGFQEATDGVEAALVSIWAEVLGREPGSIGVTDDFFQIGGHSLRATMLAGRVHRELDCEIPLAEIFRDPTVRGMAAFVRGASKEALAAVSPVEEKDYYPLSSAQKRLVVMQTMEPGSTAYNITRVVGLAEDADIEGIQQAFSQLVKRHESLRTGFITMDKSPVQRVMEIGDFSLERFDLSLEHAQSSTIELAVRSFIRPFDLSRPPLIRAGLFLLPGRGPVLAVDIHHIACDGSSMEILLAEFRRLLEGDALPELGLRYADYAEWQTSEPIQARIAGQEHFWLDLLSGHLPQIELPLDFPRPAVKSFGGKRMMAPLPEEMSAQVVAIAADSGATVYMVMLAVFTIFLAKLSGQEDILLGTPTAGRTHPDLQPLVGMFVNTVVLRNYPSAEKTLRGFLTEVRRNTVQAFENQDFQFEDIVELLGISRQSGRNPIFDTMFEYTPVDGDAPAGNEGDGGEREFQGDSKFDLVLNVIRYQDRLALAFTYDVKLFKPDTVRRFNRYFQDILGAVIDDPDRKIKEIDITLDFCDEDVAMPDMDFDF
jgi:amino acid adenylation domain-containing protein